MNNKHKFIVFNGVTDPGNPITGFPDTVHIYNSAGVLEYSNKASTSPNGIKPGTGAPWYKEYGWVASGEYMGDVVTRDKWGRCIMLENGGILPSRNPNPNHRGQYIITEVFIHPANAGGKNPQWRGSAGCLTLHRDKFETFMDQIPDGKHTVIINDTRP